MQIIITLLIFIACINASILHVLSKYNALNWYELHRKLWMPERCEFCICFWLSVLQMACLLIWANAGPASDLVLICFAAPSLSLFIYNRR